MTSSSENAKFHDLKSNAKNTSSLIEVHIGHRLRIRRSTLGLSQEKVASLLGLSFQQVQKYERGLNRISASRLYELSKILDVPLSYFFEGIEPATSSVLKIAEEEDNALAHVDLLATRETLELVRAYYLIHEAHHRKKVLELIRALGTTSSQDENLSSTAEPLNQENTK